MKIYENLLKSTKRSHIILRDCANIETKIDVWQLKLFEMSPQITAVHFDVGKTYTRFDNSDTLFFIQGGS